MRTQPDKPGDMPTKKNKPNPWAKISVGDAVSIYQRANGEIIIDAIAAVVKGGDALLFGATSDRGAVSITWLHGGKKEKLYPATTEQLEDALSALTLYYE